MDRKLQFEVDCRYQVIRSDNYGLSRNQLIARILKDWEECGKAMRYCRRDGRIAWKVTPEFLDDLASAEAEVRDDLEL